VPITGAVQTVTAGKNITVSTVGDNATVGLTQGTLEGQVLIANTATGEAQWNRITPGAGVNVTNGDGSITISTAAAAGDLTIAADGGTTATSVAGTIKVQGTAGHITSTGDMADKVTIDLPVALTAIDSLTNTNTAFALNTGTGTLSISNDASATTVGLATGAAAKTVTLGSTTTTSKLDLKYGTNDFTVASATGTTIKALDTGAVTLPLQPRFLAVINPELNVTGDGTVHSIGSVVAMTESYDIGGNFFPGDGAGNPATYTIPIDGNYLFTCSLSAHIETTGGNEMRWYMSDGGVGYGGINLPTRNRCEGFYGTNAFITLPSTITKYFTAGTVLTLVFVSDGGAKVDEAGSGFWSGCLLG
jgi:hypothetical protein